MQSVRARHVRGTGPTRDRHHLACAPDLVRTAAARRSPGRGRAAEPLARTRPDPGTRARFDPESCSGLPSRHRGPIPGGRRRGALRPGCGSPLRSGRRHRASGAARCRASESSRPGVRRPGSGRRHRSDPRPTYGRFRRGHQRRGPGPPHRACPRPRPARLLRGVRRPRLARHLRGPPSPTLARHRLALPGPRRARHRRVVPEAESPRPGGPRAGPGH